MRKARTVKKNLFENRVHPIFIATNDDAFDAMEAAEEDAGGKGDE